MFAKRLLQKSVHHSQQNVQRGDLKSEDLDLRVAIHYGIPSTASILAFDPIQRLLAIGTLDGRIKVIGGDGIEGLLISPKQLPYKYLEFIQNQGFLIGISNDNDIQVWNLETRHLACCLQWESNITAFCLIGGSHFMYIGDEYGILSVVKYDGEDGKLSHLPYNITANSLSEAAGFSFPDDQPIVGILPQPHSSGDRVIIAYANGLIILWDVSKSQIPFIGGGKDLQLKDAVDSDVQDDTFEHHLQEKEISAICWASSDGSILAVGYVDGDILFWNTSITSSKGERNGQNKNVVKLQLSSAERKLPVIVLQWSSNNTSRNDYNGKLFIYGGDEIGSEEVLTVLSLEWSSGMETVRCIGRVDLTLTGSFADMTLLPTAGATGGNHKADLFVLTNPGQLHLYDGTNLSTLLSEKERKQFAHPVEFPMFIPTADPSMTVGKFSALPAGGISLKCLSELASITKLCSTPTPAAGIKWPLTGGVPTQLAVSKDNSIDKLYIAGYQDGSVRIWDASYPILTLLFVLEGEVQGTNMARSSVPVTTLNFCWHTLNLAVGNECGVVSIYYLGRSDKTSFHYVTETRCEVQSFTQGKGPQCKAVFSLLKSPVQALHFGNCGAKLTVGFEFGRVAMLDVSSPSILFLTDCVSSSSSPIISLSWLEFKNVHSHVKSPEHSETDVAIKPEEEIIFILTKDAKIISINGANGEMIHPHPWHLKKEETALSMYIIENSFPLSILNCEKRSEESNKDTTAKIEAELDASSTGTEHPSSSEAASSLEHSLDTLLLLCCENSLRLYSMKSVIQGKDKTIHKVNHTRPCCWTTTFKKDGRVCGLLLLFQTGDMEIRSLPDLELVKESSIKSILRWNYKANMDKLMTSDNAQVALTSGCEMAFISLLAGANDFRIPESLPCLHDRVLAAAADAALSFSSDQKKKQGMAPGILGGIVKGFKGGKVNTSAMPESNFTHLESKFSKTPFIDTSQNVNKHEEMELDIDDIEIDDTPPVTSSSSHEAVQTKGGKETDREKLLGAADDSTPRVRTAQEIIAKYRKAGDASSAAAHARNKLVERREKLERINRRTEELQSGAENFASLADELVKAMENRKWWQIYCKRKEFYFTMSFVGGSMNLPAKSVTRDNGHPLFTNSKQTELQKYPKKPTVSPTLAELLMHVDDAQNSPVDHRAVEIGYGCSSLPSSNPFFLCFNNLTYSVKVRKKLGSIPFCGKNSDETESNGINTKILLNEISGEAHEGEIMAVLGASGSGKSTLIDALANRIAKDSLKGTLTLNGEVLESKLLRVISAYVMQDDLLFPMLTVEETLMFSAEFRLPRSLSKLKKKARVQALIDQLGLRSAAKTVIGDEGHRGVSGGERRRVSIGIDIIHDPIVLFLDEPTSGLDSTSAFMVVKVLQRIAQSGSIVIMSIHQPSYRILSLLDRLIFLSHGNTVFAGSPGMLPSFFAEFGHPIPENENKTEFALDLIRELEETPGGTKSLVEFNKSWQARKNQRNGFSMRSNLSLKDAISASISKGKLVSGATNDSNPTASVPIYANPLWIEMMVIAKRSMTNSRRMPELFGIRLGAVVITGIILATMFWKLDNSPKGIQERLGFFAFAMSTTFYTCAEAIPVFLQERYIFMRETAYNAYRRSSYVLAHSLISIPSLVILSMAFAAITFWAVGLAGGLSGFFFFFLTIFASFWAGSSFVTFLSGIVSHVMLGFTVVVAVLAYFLLFSGFFISRNRIPLYWIWFHYISLVKYPYEAVLQNEFDDPTKCFVRGVQMFDNTPLGEVPLSVKLKLLQSMSGVLGANITGSTCVTTGEDLLVQQGITDIRKWNCLWIIIAWGFFFRILFYFTLLLGSKNKRK